MVSGIACKKVESEAGKATLPLVNENRKGTLTGGMKDSPLSGYHRWRGSAKFFSQDDSLARLVERVVNQVLEAQVTEHLKTKAYERTEERQGYRNSHRGKSVVTRIGRPVLEVPRVRSGEFSPLAPMEMVINGVPMRKVKALVEELCGAEFSKSTVSKLCKRLDSLVKTWNERD